MRKRLLVVAAALVDAEGRVLLARRPEGKHLGGMYEFPGGKIEPEETPEQALIREFREELGVELCPTCFAPVTFVTYPYVEHDLILLLYIARKWEGIPTPHEGQELIWRRPRDMRSLPMPPADVPLVEALMDLL